MALPNEEEEISPEEETVFTAEQEALVREGIRGVAQEDEDIARAMELRERLFPNWRERLSNNHHASNKNADDIEPDQDGCMR